MKSLVDFDMNQDRLNFFKVKKNIQAMITQINPG